ncbi:hypothetical protein Trydic_g20871 [Trypoxylus dichotomus]
MIKNNGSLPDKPTVRLSFSLAERSSTRSLLIAARLTLDIDEAKSYRPISLTSFLLKTLEKIIDKHLRDSALSRLSLHENQYAYKSGKSCEQAIHELARRAEIAFRHKEIALATFLDIEGAFDRASFLSMERALQRRGNAHQVDDLYAKQQNSSYRLGKCVFRIAAPSVHGRLNMRANDSGY